MIPLWLNYDKNTGRILAHGSGADYAEEMLPRLPDQGSGSHYVAWTQTDANGRPVDPTILPRAELEVSVVKGYANPEVPVVVAIFGAPPMTVLVDGAPVLCEEDEIVDERVAVVLELNSPIPKTWRIAVDEVSRFAPETLAEVR